MTEMREFHEDRYGKEDPYDLHQIPGAKRTNDYKIDLLPRAPMKEVSILTAARRGSLHHTLNARGREFGAGEGRTGRCCIGPSRILGL